MGGWREGKLKKNWREKSEGGREDKEGGGRKRRKE